VGGKRRKHASAEKEKEGQELGKKRKSPKSFVPPAFLWVFSLKPAALAAIMKRQEDEVTVDLPLSYHVLFGRIKPGSVRRGQYNTTGSRGGSVP
jgi:hypothetical protein